MLPTQKQAIITKTDARAGQVTAQRSGGAAAVHRLAVVLRRRRKGRGEMALWRVLAGGEYRLARGPAGQGPQELLPASRTIDGLLGGASGELAAAMNGPAAGPVPQHARIAAPIGSQEVWAAGVTYKRSRDARVLESGTPDPYERVYRAERPELFLKAAPGRVRGPGEPVGIRDDSTWDVPEPELAVVADRSGQIVGYLNGNDMSSRSIEGENPLYLPQAKIYTGSCAVGPCLATPDELPDLVSLLVSLRVVRDGAEVFSDTVKVADLNRRPDDLMRWLFRALDFPVGVVLLTGTAIVPPPTFTLRAADEVIIATTGLGELRNTVEVIGPAQR
jgi:2-dehydro-3-deoxy-D-arabinonate dehydratase